MTRGRVRQDILGSRGFAVTLRLGAVVLEVYVVVLQVLLVGFEGGQDLPDPRGDQRDKIGFAVHFLEGSELADLADGKQADIR